MSKSQIRYSISKGSREFIEASAKLKKQTPGEFIDWLVLQLISDKASGEDLTSLVLKVEQFRNGVEGLLKLLLNDLEENQEISSKQEK